MRGGYTPIIESCLTLQMSDLKRMGFFSRAGAMHKVVRWENGSSIDVTVDDAKRLMTLSYTCEGGKEIKYNIVIVTRPANIGKGVIRYFICPVAKTLCRKLRMLGEVFMSVRAMQMYGAMYLRQTQDKMVRLVPMGYNPGENTPYKHRGKTHYRGKTTPYGKRIERFEQRCAIADDVIDGFIIKRIPSRNTDDSS